MDRLIYTAISGANAALNRQSVLAACWRRLRNSGNGSNTQWKR
jgi:flagellar basal body rod protein FlgF